MATGEVELVAHQISEIIPVKGVTLVGPLPKELQKVTIDSAGLAGRSTAPEMGRTFIRFVTGPAFIGLPRVSARVSRDTGARPLARDPPAPLP